MFREAAASDAEAVARLHADSWRRHYRGSYSDSFLDGDVLADRLEVWSGRLARPDEARITILGERDGELVGFINIVLGSDARWGALVDNLHVVHSTQRSGIGRQLMCRGAETVTAAAPGDGIYLWVLERNQRAQAFYSALGGTEVEREPVGPPGGVPGRLAGSPVKLRIAWPDARELLAAGQPARGPLSAAAGRISRWRASARS